MNEQTPGIVPPLAPWEVKGNMVKTMPAAPYHFTPDEVQTFLRFHQNDGRVQEYLRTKQPPYGIIVNESVAPGVVNDLLVWVDASDKIHVVYVSGMSIVEQVKKAPYVSPDDKGFWETFKEDFARTMKSVTNIAMIVAVALVAAAVLKRR